MNINDLDSMIRIKNTKSSKILEGVDFSCFGKQGQSYRGDWQNEQYVIWSNKGLKKR